MWRFDDIRSPNYGTRAKIYLDIAARCHDKIFTILQNRLFTGARII